MVGGAPVGHLEAGTSTIDMMFFANLTEMNTPGLTYTWEPPDPVHTLRLTDYLGIGGSHAKFAFFTYAVKHKDAELLAQSETLRVAGRQFRYAVTRSADGFLEHRKQPRLADQQLPADVCSVATLSSSSMKASGMRAISLV